MKLSPTSSPLALAAILAASAIPFTAASAQDITPDTTPPAAANPAPDAPPAASVVEAPVSAPIVAAPVAAPQVSAPIAAAPAATSANAARKEASPTVKAHTAARSIPARTVATVAVTSASQASPVKADTVVAPSTAKPVAAMPAAAGPAVLTAPQPNAPRAETTAPAKSDDITVPLALGGLLLGCALAGAALSRRRRKVISETETAYEPDYVAEPVVAEPGYEPAMAAEPSPTQPFLATPATAARDWHEPVIIPAGPLPTGEEREALIRRMVAAPPDECNPFHSTKRRRKRARMLLHSAELNRRQAATEPFDFRTYKPFSQSEPAEVDYQAYREREPLN